MPFTEETAGSNPAQDNDSRLILGWSMTTHTRSSLVVDALKMALARPGPGLIHRSDQGGSDGVGIMRKSI
jgi:transposase InsO family protein